MIHRTVPRAEDGWPDRRGRRWAAPLSERARTALASGGGHLHGLEAGEPRARRCEAMAAEVTADRPLRVEAGHGRRSGNG